jgi:hypothetical protein
MYLFDKIQIVRLLNSDLNQEFGCCKRHSMRPTQLHAFNLRAISYTGVVAK